MPSEAQDRCSIIEGALAPNSWQAQLHAYAGCFQHTDIFLIASFEVRHPVASHGLPVVMT